jgi:hypothetical protein
MNTFYLILSWSISRGRNTYGYNICRLDTPAGRYRTMGGGYDMVGTVVADWLTAQYQERLAELAPFYGLEIHDGVEYIDGACGLQHVKQIAEAIGVTWSEVTARRRNWLQGFMVTDYGSDVALMEARS